MVNVCDVTQWFRDATSDKRLATLCRLIDCCMPLELQFLNTYLDELLRRNVIATQQPDDSNMPELQEITDSTCRRQLCLILTRLKSANVLASCIYDILIQYNFSEFFSRVMVMEEELVDEILLLFTLAANHPAMSFSQRLNLHQRLLDLRETIEKSFKCYHATDVCSQHNQEYVCKPLEKPSTREVTNLRDQLQPTAETPKAELNMQPADNDVAITDVPANKNNSGVHIKDLRMVRVQQRPFDKKYEYIFEVTWSNGKVFRIHRAYGELFDFQCKLRRRFSKEISKMTERKVIPYLPARRPIKLCKGSQILPDITQYVSDFTKLPEKLLHSESVENFFSDGTDKHLDEKQTTSKTKQNSHHEKKDHTNATCKRTDASRVNVDVKSDKGAGSIKNHSPKGKYLSSFCGRKLQLSGRIDSRKRPSLSPKTNTSDIATTSKVESKGKTNHYQPKTILKSPNASSTQSSTLNKTINEEIKIDSSLRTQNSLPGEKLEPERTIISKDIHLKTNINDSNNKNTITGKPNPRTDIGIEENTGSCPSTSVVKQETSSTQTSLSPSTDGSVVLPPSTVSSSSPLTKVTSSLSEASAMASLGDTSSTHTSSGSSTTSSTITSSEMTSPESLIVSSSPRTLSCSAPSTAISLPVTSLSMTPSKLLTTTSSVMPSSAMMSSALSFVTSTILNMTSSTPSTNTSPTVNMITSFAKPIMTSSFSTPPDLTVKLPQTPLTVAVPILSPPCTTCSISNQSSSDGSVTSTLSRTPVSSPAIARTSDDISGHDNAANMEFCFDPHMFNGSTTTLTTTDPRSSPCKSSSGKNGYTNHHHNILAHGLLIVPNGYHLSSSSDTSLPYDYDYHTADAKQPEEFYHDASTSNGAKTNDKNCNYIIQNGGRHDQAVDFNSNNSHEYKHTRYLNQKSNGFSKPFCYNCGECGHHGSQCSETELEESIVS